ncbi:hypothetical protein Tco_0836317 [Tanacetum coccineum]
MPLAIKTHNDSFTFVHELEPEMHADLKYVESLEKEINELESDKEIFSNMYDILLQECMSNGVMCSYLHSLSNLDAHAELQCLYVYKAKECECLAQNLLKQTETVSKEVYNELLRIFAKLEKHSISLELVLQQCQEQMKNDTVCKEKASNVFLREREQYFEIQDLKAQFQDKDIAISELNKLIEKMKEEAKKKAQLQKDKALNTKPSMQQSARLPNTANGNKPKPRSFNQQPRNWPPSMSSRVSNRTVNTAEPPRNQKSFLMSKVLINEYKGIMPTKIELTLKQSQQGVSNDVLAETGSIHNLSVFTKINSDIEERHHGPSDAMHNPYQLFKFLSTDTYLICHGDTHVIY